MKVSVLGCSGAIAKGRRTTSFLVDDHLLVDAGTGVGELSLADMARIDDVVLSHGHLDHIAALPLMVDAVANLRTSPLQVHALAGTIAALRAHIFNNVIWPDFENIPTPESPFIHFNIFNIGDVLNIKGKTVEILPAIHTVPAAAFAISDGGPAWVFSGDTGPNPAFWERVNQINVGALVVETAFSNAESDLAERSQHLSPAALGEELSRIARPGSFPVWITHTKPAETQVIMAEINRLPRSATGVHPALQIAWLTEGQVFQW
jgi:ribonuclease BN (tRNA processing enzyme)